MRDAARNHPRQLSLSLLLVTLTVLSIVKCTDALSQCPSRHSPFGDGISRFDSQSGKTSTMKAEAATTSFVGRSTSVPALTFARRHSVVSLAASAIEDIDDGGTSEEEIEEVVLCDSDYDDEECGVDDGTDTSDMPAPLRGAKAKNLLECSAFIVLPFSAEVAFDAFSDLRRQPSWCKYLRSVEYIGLVDGDENAASASDSIPLRNSRWTVGVKGFRFSWTANDTCIERPGRIEWASTSGLRNAGSVTFVEREKKTTEMAMQFTFVAPRVVAGAFRRAGYVRNYVENVLLVNMLTDFRDVIVAEEKIR